MQDKADLLEGLRHAANILSTFVTSIPVAKRELRRGEGFWTIAEHVHHLAQVQPMLLDRFQRFINEDQPQFIPFVPVDGKAEAVTPQPIDVTDALQQFALYRDRQLALLATIDATTWQKTGSHPEYEEYSLYILARHVLMHDFWHMYRMEELWLTKDNYLTSLI